MEQLIALITAISIQHGVDPNLAVAIAKTESRLNPAAVGTIGEIGIFQLRPEYYADSCDDVPDDQVVGTTTKIVVKKGVEKTVKVRTFACGHELFNARVNIEIGIKHLAELQRRCAALGEAFFVCHNVGVTGGHRLKQPREFAYYKAVMKNFEKREIADAQHQQERRIAAAN